LTLNPNQRQQENLRERDLRAVAGRGRRHPQDDSHALSRRLPSTLRVMQVIYRFQEGGAERVAMNIADGLRGTAVKSSICSTVPATSMKTELAPDIPLYELARRPGNDPRFVWQLYQLLKRERPHILQTHSWGTLCEGLIAARMAGVPVVVHLEHGTLQTKNYQLRVQRWAWQRTDRLLAVCSQLGDRMARTVSVPRGSIHVIRNGVDVKRFEGHHRNVARLRLGLPSDALVIGTAGRLAEVKDHESLLKALAILSTGGLPAFCLIAGEGPLKSTLESRIKALGLAERVRLLGHRADIEAVLAALDMFVLSSRSEGLPMAILEAMASGLPVISTRVGGVEEVMEDGRTGLLVEPGSAEQLARAIGRLARDRDCRARMGAAGRARARRDLSLEAMVANYERLYWEVAKERQILEPSRHVN
jgi:sugar transferase (PEP-CTERM/EpsH1 system associated)